MACNIPYSIENQEKLLTNISLLYSDFMEDPDVEYIKDEMLSLYPIDEQSSISIKDLSSGQNQDFYNAINDFVIRESLVDSLEKIPPAMEEFRQAVLSGFFDMATEIKAKSFKNEEESAETEDEIQERTLIPIEQAALNIYGRQNIILMQNIEKKFYDQLKELLIINPGLAIKYNYTTSQVNKIISQYKQDKFKRVLNYLKAINADDKRLQSISGMYAYGQLKAADFRYVIDQFQKYLNGYNNLNDVLNKQLIEKTSLKYKEKQNEAYKELLEFVKSHKDLKTWFNNKFNSDKLKDEASRLFEGDRFSNQYKIIKDALSQEIENNNETVIKLLETIEQSDNELVDIVDDFFILTQFDHLLQYKLRDNFKIDPNYTVGSEPLTQVNIKYIIHDSHKHQKAGWEQGNDESSEKHTSANIKDILEKLYVYKYNDANQVTPQVLTLASINSAWQSLIKDLLFNGAYINLSRKEDGFDITEKIKQLFQSSSQNMLGNTIEIFKLLFDGSYRGIDYIRGGNQLNEQHKNILYSFYKHILQKDEINKSSFFAQESERLNKNHSNFLELTTDLVAILHRNVNNNFIDCDLRTGEVKTRSKFNWDSQLFELVESILSNSKRDQRSPATSREWVDKFNSGNNSISITFNIGGKDYQFGYVYGTGSKRKIFSNDNTLKENHGRIKVQKEITRGKNKGIKEVDTSLLDILAEIDLEEFKKKIIKDGNVVKENLTMDESALYTLLEFFDQYLNTDFLSEQGMEVLQYYKINYKADSKNKIFSKNYLDPLLRLSLRLVEAQKQALNAKEKGISLKQYLEADETSMYGQIFIDQQKKSDPDLFSFEGPEVYFKSLSTNNQTLSNLVKARMMASGESMKSTIINKQGATVSNFSIARAGSKLYQRLYEQRQSQGAAASLLFVQNPDILDPDPVIDSEVVTTLGDVKAVREMAETELFSHAIIDKFYGSFINNDKILFQPTVYSDKIQFFNYYSKLTNLGDNPLNMYTDNKEALISLYQQTFFGAHNAILESVYNKIEKLMSWGDEAYRDWHKPEHAKFTEIVSSDTGTTRFETINHYLKSLTQEELNTLVEEYNKYNTDKIALELDKDYRVFNGHCAVNEILREYATLAVDKTAVTNYLQKQADLYIQDLKSYGMSFKVFDYSRDMDKWVNDKLPLYRASGILRALSDEKILNIKDRKKFAEQWISNTGELILTDNAGNINPFFEKFFYIEGLYSNNLRLSLTGSEINHPDKAKSLFKKLAKLSNQFKKGEKNLSAYKKMLVDNKVFSEDITDQQILEFHEVFYDKSLAELKDYSGLYEQNIKIIYDSSILETTNTAQGTQFKRNVIIPATLETPITGMINGMANEVNVAVVYDMEAPVNNLRYSSAIDSQDGSARISYIQYKLENNGLGDHKVGTNRKPIWDAQTEDLSSFLAKFAAFGVTNASMIQSQGSKASDYALFKKMHNIRWNNSIDITSSIYKVQGVPYSQDAVDTWFKTRILEGNCLYYKNAYDQIIEITGFGKDESGNYFTMEKLKGSSRSKKVYHYFDSASNHYTTPIDNGHTIDSLYELFVALGGVHCVDDKGKPSEFTQDVLTNFVINVGYKKAPGSIATANDVVQPLKDKFVAYVLNNTAVKNGAKNINSAERWTDDKALNTFKVTTGGLGIQLNADHDVIDSEMTEFSQVIAACAAYGKEFGYTNELFYGLGKSAAIASRKELAAIQEYLTKATKDPVQAKYDLYVIIGKLMTETKSNSEFDLTDQVKQEVDQLLKIDKTKYKEDDIKLPFSDPSLYRQFITNITSVINSKSIKRKHPGAAYVMVPAYNVVQYFQVYNEKTGTYDKHLFADVLRLAKQDMQKTILDALTPIMGEDKIKFLKASGLASIIEKGREKLKTDTIPYLNIAIDDIHNYERMLVSTFLASKQKNEPMRAKEWFMPTDIVNINTARGVFTHSLDDMADYYKFKNGLFDIEDENDVTIKATTGKFVITSNKDKSVLILEKNYANHTWGVSYLGNSTAETDLVNAAMELIPIGDIISLNPNTQVQTNGVLTEADIVNYGNFISTLSTITGAQLISGDVKPMKYDSNGVILEAKVQQFKKVANLSNNTYQLNVTAPNNLKPSLIRWQYRIDKTTGLPITEETLTENIETRYMTIYDHPVIRNNWNGKKSKQSDIQKVLDLLHKGKFMLGDQEVDIVEGSLENTEAELVLGNMYSEVFDTKGYSLSEILEKGPEFFKDQALDEVKELPKGWYHIALLKTNGDHVLISCDNVLETGVFEHNDSSTMLNKVPINIKNEEVKDNEIYDNKGIKIGKYVKSTWDYREGKVYDGNNEVSSDRYRLIFEEGTNRVLEVMERIDYIHKYKQQNSVKVGDKYQTHSYTLYKIGSLDDIARSFYTPKKDSNGKEIAYRDLSESDKKELTINAKKQVAHIINNIYKQDKYNDIRINPGRLLNLSPENKMKIQERLSEYLSKVGEVIIESEGKKKELTSKELLNITPEDYKNLSKFKKYIVNVRRLLMTDDFDSKYSSLYNEYYRGLNLYQKRYVSFLNSLYFISSRIPAQSLQSFMPMKCIGWTGDSNNTAYVSYIQTFLQGSDYDIDKAYIMGQSFDNGVYIGWSNLFDYSSLETLQASKTLPIPRGVELVNNNESRYNVDQDLDSIIATSNKAARIRKIAQLIRKINNNNYNYNYDTTSKKKRNIMEEIKEHATYDIPQSHKNQAYKNVSSSNIFNIVHSIINRDQAYSDITMRDLQEQAENSPKGLKTKQLNMINPLTKYIMQYQNLVGKDVIGIAANGEKDWFNITYWYHDLLRNGNAKDLTYLLMSHDFTRIRGRAANTYTQSTVTYIPDIWNVNEELSYKLKELFKNEGLGEQDKYVDQLISQLLSAATDNAKELILAKINAGTQLAKYHLHLMMMGFSLDDIVAFMTSPVIELIDKFGKSDIYANKNGSVNIAINILKGNLKLSDFIKAEQLPEMDDDALAEYYEYQEQLALESEGKEVEYSWVVNKLSGMYSTVKATSLKDFIQKYFKAKLNDNLTEDEKTLLAPLIDPQYELPTNTDSFNTNYFFKQVNQIVNDIRTEIDSYKERLKISYSMDDFYKDLEEFEELTKQANETSTLASVWLKLNQGIPQTDEDLIKLMRNMRKSISDRESNFGILRLIPKTKRLSLLDVQEEEVKDKGKKQKYLEALQLLQEGSTKTTDTTSEVLDIITAIEKNNKKLERGYIINILYDAIKYDIYGNFDLYKFLGNEKIAINPEESKVFYNTRVGEEVSYREIAADYYNLIKSSWNILDMVNRIPTYHQNINLLNYTLQQRQIFANKAAIIDELLDIHELRNKSIDPKQYKEITKYVDKIIITSFFFNLKEPISIQNIPDSKVYTSKYDLVDSDFIHLNTLHGIDSLKYFVENQLVLWLQSDSRYKDNAFVKGLTQSSYYGNDLLKTKLDLSKIYDSYTNKRLYNQYLLGFQELLGKNAKIFGEYTIGDLFMLYNLAVNRNKIGGRFMTAVFKNSVTPETILYKYYSFIGNNDNSTKEGSEKFKYIAPTKKDFLISIAPTVKSKAALQYMQDPYVKVLNPMTGYDVYKGTNRFGKWTYSSVPEAMIDLEGSEIVSLEQQELRQYYYSKSLNMFPELHRRMNDTDVFTQVNNENIIETISRLKDILYRYSREGRLLFTHDNCI